MGRAKRALAAVAILAALAAASIATAPRAAAEGGELSGDLPVAGGVALVSWSGGPAEALAEAARSRGCNVRSAYEANVAPANAAFLDAHFAGSPAPSPVFVVVCGEPVPPRIVFLGDVTEERRAAIRDEVASVVRFYAERFGVAVAESTLYVSPDGDAAAAAFRDLTGREYPLFTGEGGTVTDTPEAGILAFVSGGFVNLDHHGGDTFSRVLAHEHYHVIQYDICRRADLCASPEWLIEGTATYGEYLYGEARDRFDASSAWMFASLNELAKFEDVASPFGIVDYELAASAISWLVDASGNPHSHLEYWRTLASGKEWTAAFTSAFGLTVGEFFDAFEEYRTTTAEAQTHSFRGKVVDLEGNGLSGVHVDLGKIADDYGVGPGGYAVTDNTGAFEVRVPDGQYVLRLGRIPGSGHDGSGEEVFGIFLDFVYGPSGWAKTLDAIGEPRVGGQAYYSGYANVCGSGEEVLTIAGAVDVEVKILPNLLHRAVAPPCNEGVPGYRVVQGRIFGPDGEPYTRAADALDLIKVSAAIIRENTTWPFEAAETDGTFRIAVPEGVPFVLQIKAVDNFYSKPIGWYGESGFTTDPGEATWFEIGESDIGGIEVRLPADPASMPQNDRPPPRLP